MLDSITKTSLSVGIGISLFVIIQLIREGRVNHEPIKIGITILVVWVLRFSLFYIKFDPWALNFPVLLVIDQYLFLLDGPLLWLYTRSVLESNRLTIHTFWHFAPFILGVAVAVTGALFFPEDIVNSFKNSLAALQNNQPILQPGVIGFIIFLLAFTFFYFLRSRSELGRYNASLMENFSNIEGLRMNWILSFQTFWILLFGFPLVVYFINYLYPTISVFVTGGILLISLVSLAVYFSSRLLSQSYVNLPPSSHQEIDKVTAELSEDDQRQLHQLYDTLAHKKYYEDEQLSLNQLADYLNIKPRELTDLIKNSEYNNFYDLINSFRVEHVKQALANSNEQIIVIAYQSGFNSKSTFNKIFKQKTGYTPKEYRLSLK